jgi:hypothetical protein
MVRKIILMTPYSQPSSQIPPLPEIGGPFWGLGLAPSGHIRYSVTRDCVAEWPQNFFWEGNTPSHPSLLLGSNASIKSLMMKNDSFYHRSSCTARVSDWYYSWVVWYPRFGGPTRPNFCTRIIYPFLPVVAEWNGNLYPQLNAFWRKWPCLRQVLPVFMAVTYPAPITSSIASVLCGLSFVFVYLWGFTHKCQKA